MKVFTVNTETDKDGNVILPIPKEIIDTLGWKEGDDVEFDIKDGSVYISKANK